MSIRSMRFWRWFRSPFSSSSRTTSTLCCKSWIATSSGGRYTDSCWGSSISSRRLFWGAPSSRATRILVDGGWRALKPNFVTDYWTLNDEFYLGCRSIHVLVSNNDFALSRVRTIESFIYSLPLKSSCRGYYLRHIQHFNQYVGERSV